jgi:hypothetical protein
MSQMEVVINDWPPNINEIRNVLPVTDRNIFAYDNKIFNPSGGKLPPELHAHEAVHFKQQAEIGVEAWWQNFLEDPVFRLAQEIPAHKEEYRVYCLFSRDRNERAKMLRRMGQRLAAPMYGGIITINEAMKAIR